MKCLYILIPFSPRHVLTLALGLPSNQLDIINIHSKRKELFFPNLLELHIHANQDTHQYKSNEPKLDGCVDGGGVPLTKPHSIDQSYARRYKYRYRRRVDRVPDNVNWLDKKDARDVSSAARPVCFGACPLAASAEVCLTLELKVSLVVVARGPSTYYKCQNEKLVRVRMQSSTQASAFHVSRYAHGPRVPIMIFLSTSPLKVVSSPTVEPAHPARPAQGVRYIIRLLPRTVFPRRRPRADSAAVDHCARGARARSIQRSQFRVPEGPVWPKASPGMGITLWGTGSGKGYEVAGPSGEEIGTLTKEIYTAKVCTKRSAKDDKKYRKKTRLLEAIPSGGRPAGPLRAGGGAYGGARPPERPGPRKLSLTVNARDTRPTARIRVSGEAGGARAGGSLGALRSRKITNRKWPAPRSPAADTNEISHAHCGETRTAK
ncbi:hypothetical protein EVAR_86224_1 [Eumeta japonica]|uniref:Uncharacterized protein n=1 Tax=Eumeta variegata TaxID=151549 RepID=A0A4C1UCJ5_EUMVA|nr:hypothetical protein EVAR_86224_1 [Eumeta japonica]